ncbi:MAG: DHH family phosphoesterase [Acidobacteriota bacterium]
MEKLLKVLNKTQPVAVVVHNNPDPDALACALGLLTILKKKGCKGVKIYYDGLVGRAENKAMVKYLSISLFKTRNTSFPESCQFVLVDSQPFSGNVTLPQKAKCKGAIDHHPKQKKTSQLPFLDIRPDYGASSTIIYEYFSSQDMTIPRNIATAIFYAIFSETQGLGREGSPADRKAYLELLPQTNFSQLSKIQFPSLPKEFVAQLSDVLLNTFYYKNLCGVVLDQLPYPDFVAEMADFLLRVRNISWSLCVGVFKDLVYVSIRTSSEEPNAPDIIKKIIPRHGSSGGHDSAAGAQIKADRRNKKYINSLKKDIVRKMLRELNHKKVKTVYHLVNNEEFFLFEEKNRR